MPQITVPCRVWLAKDGKTAVLDGDSRAASLLVGRNQAINEESYKKYGIAELLNPPQIQEPKEPKEPEEKEPESGEQEEAQAEEKEAEKPKTTKQAAPKNKAVKPEATK
jgi:hypothetical protein